MELTDLKAEIVFNLKKIVVVRSKIRMGKLHKITACEVAFQCADPGTVFGAVVRFHKYKLLFWIKMSMTSLDRVGGL